MGKTVAELLGSVSSRELAEWRAYERVEGPIGWLRDDWRAALVACAAVSPWAKKGKTPKVADYLLEFEEQAPIEPSAFSRAARVWDKVKAIFGGRGNRR